jgi:hypothetical protein
MRILTIAASAATASAIGLAVLTGPAQAATSAAGLGAKHPYPGTAAAIRRAEANVHRAAGDVRRAEADICTARRLIHLGCRWHHHGAPGGLLNVIVDNWR